VDVVIISAINSILAKVTIAALHAGKHVLCEKPLGISSEETWKMVNAARRTGCSLKTGFNLRYHPAIRRAKEILRSGGIGPVLFARCIYGHAGFTGREKYWRSDPSTAGGGGLLDQGMHVVDLFRWFIGDFNEVYGMVSSHYWDMGSFPKESQSAGPKGGMRLEDNAFVLLRTPQGKEAMFHASWTQWKRRFEFEVFGEDGYIRVDGLGGEYGVERLIWGTRRPESGTPDERCWEFPGPDLSWSDEWADFSSNIQDGLPPIDDGREGLEAMRVIDAIYESAMTGKRVHLRPVLQCA
jgi:predicted dehydrogenase